MFGIVNTTDWGLQANSGLTILFNIVGNAISPRGGDCMSVFYRIGLIPNLHVQPFWL